MQDQSALYIRGYYEKQGHLVNDVARLANELQAEFPEMGRTAALRESERLVELRGMGLSFRA